MKTFVKAHACTPRSALQITRPVGVISRAFREIRTPLLLIYRAAQEIRTRLLLIYRAAREIRTRLLLIYRAALEQIFLCCVPDYDEDKFKDVYVIGDVPSDWRSAGQEKTKLQGMEPYANILVRHVLVSNPMKHTEGNHIILSTPT